MILYIAGPMRGYPLYNFPAFDDAAAKLRAAGYEVISPAEMDRDDGFNPETDEATPAFVQAALGRDCAAIMECDGVAVLPGWHASAGTLVELAAAINLNIRVGSVQLFLNDAEGAL